MKNSNKLGLVFSLLAIVSVFLPWAKASSSYSSGGIGSGSYSTGAISGITLGVGIAGTFAGVEYNTYYNDILFFGFHQGIKRSLKDYLEINAIGVKFVRVTSPPIKCM